MLAPRDREAMPGTMETARAFYCRECHGKRDDVYDRRRSLALQRAAGG